MDILEAIRERRSIKYYDASHEMTAQEEQSLLEHALQAPTSFNLQHWRFVMVKDKALRKEVRAAAFDQAHVEDSSLLIVLCADLKAWAKNPAALWRNAPQEVQDIIVPMIKPFYEGKGELERDEAMRSVGLVAQTIMLAAKGMGYDSCPMIGFDEAKVGKLVNLPEDHVIGMMITVGKGIKPAWPKPGQLSLEEVVVVDRF